MLIRTTPDRILRIILALSLGLSGCAAKSARLNQAATSTEREAYGGCTRSEATAALSRGERSLFCACKARLIQERMPPATALKSMADATAEDRALIKTIGEETTLACREFPSATFNGCMELLTQIPDAQRPEACHCMLGGLVEEFAPEELIALARQSPVQDAPTRIASVGNRCAETSDTVLGIDRDSWATALKAAAVVAVIGGIVAGAYFASQGGGGGGGGYNALDPHTPSGTCAWHGGVSHCAGGRAVCSDGWLSPQPCWY